MTIQLAPIRSEVMFDRCCLFCGDSAPLEPLGTRQYLLPTRSACYEMIFDDVVCTNCGFVFAKAVPADSFLSEYYKDSYPAFSVESGATESFEASKRLDMLNKYLSVGASVLEVGANDGAFVRALNSAGFDATGVDPLASNIEAVVPGFVSSKNMDLEVNRYDAAVSYFVLEHVIDPLGWLENLKQSVKDGGYIFIEVPDFDRFPQESLTHEHLSHFTSGHLNQLFLAAGLEPIEIASNHASRYFGITAAARKTGIPASSGLTSSGGALERARFLYQTARKLSLHQNQRLDALADRLVSLVQIQNPVAIKVWGCNEFATAIGQLLSDRGLNNVTPIDRAASKIGNLHPGFKRPIESPVLDPAYDGPDLFFLLCSPTWNQDIEAEIRSSGLKLAQIVDVISWIKAS